MAIHASARRANAKARVFSTVETWSLTGGPLVVFESDNARTDQESAWVRVTLIPSTTAWAGHLTSSFQAVDTRALLVCDVFVKDGAAEGEVFDTYAPDRIADDLEFNLRTFSVTMQDYATDPDNPTAVADAQITTVDPPSNVPLPKDGPWIRRQVSTELRWLAKHAV